MEKLRGPPLHVTKQLKIPVIFIDPVVHLFKDPWDYNYEQPDAREKLKFLEFTDGYNIFFLSKMTVKLIKFLLRFKEHFKNVPAFDCSERCAAPSDFFSGKPWLSQPKNGQPLLDLDKTDGTYFQWQIWTGTTIDHVALNVCSFNQKYAILKIRPTCLIFLFYRTIKVIVLNFKEFKKNIIGKGKLNEIPMQTLLRIQIYHSSSFLNFHIEIEF